jgi:uncharacterized protein HemY
VLERLDSHQSRISLAWVLGTSPFPRIHDPARAIGLARRALEKRPAHSTDLTTLGIAYYAAGDWKSAVETLTRADEITIVRDPSGWLFLSMALCRAGEMKRAQKVYQKAVEWIEVNNRKDVEFSRFQREAARIVIGPRPPD